MNRLGDRTGVTEQALDLLDEVLTPLLTVVADAPTSGLACESTLAARDADDLPTLRLSLWLGGWLLSDDPDRDAVGAVREYVPLVRNLGYVVSIEYGVNLSARARWELVKWLAGSRFGQLVLIATLTALGVASRTPARCKRRSALISAAVVHCNSGGRRSRLPGDYAWPLINRDEIVLGVLSEGIDCRKPGITEYRGDKHDGGKLQRAVQVERIHQGPRQGSTTSSLPR